MKRTYRKGYRPIVIAGTVAILTACSAAQIGQVTTDATTLVAALCTDAATAAKDFPTSPTAIYAQAACPLGMAAATLVKDSATAQWLQTVTAQIQADKAAATTIAPAPVTPVPAAPTKA